MKIRSLANILQKWPQRSRAVLLTCVYGLSAGVATVAFQLGMSGLYHLGLVNLAGQSKLTFVLGSLAVVVASSLLVGWLLQAFCPEAAGSGIPQLLEGFRASALAGGVGEICGGYRQHRWRRELGAGRAERATDRKLVLGRPHLLSAARMKENWFLIPRIMARCSQSAGCLSSGEFARFPVVSTFWGRLAFSWPPSCGDDGAGRGGPAGNLGRVLRCRPGL